MCVVTGIVIVQAALRIEIIGVVPGTANVTLMRLCTNPVVLNLNWKYQYELMMYLILNKTKCTS